MSSLKIIEAQYYDHKKQIKGYNVTNVLIPMTDHDHGRLVYSGFYNEIFSDPAPGAIKILKIIFEIDNYRHTATYRENEAIDLPDDYFQKNPAANNDPIDPRELPFEKKRTYNAGMVHNETIYGDKIISSSEKLKIVIKKPLGQYKDFIKDHFWPFILVVIGILGIIISYLTLIK